MATKLIGKVVVTTDNGVYEVKNLRSFNGRDLPNLEFVFDFPSVSQLDAAQDPKLLKNLIKDKLPTNAIGSTLTIGAIHPGQYSIGLMVSGTFMLDVTEEVVRTIQADQVEFSERRNEAAKLIETAKELARESEKLSREARKISFGMLTKINV